MILPAGFHCKHYLGLSISCGWCIHLVSSQLSMWKPSSHYCFLHDEEMVGFTLFNMRERSDRINAACACEMQRKLGTRLVTAEADMPHSSCVRQAEGGLGMCIFQMGKLLPRPVSLWTDVWFSWLEIRLYMWQYAGNTFSATESGQLNKLPA